MLNELQEQVRTKTAEAQAILKAANGGALADDQYEKLQALDVDVKKLESQIARVEEQSVLHSRFGQLMATLPSASPVAARAVVAELASATPQMAGTGLGDAIVQSAEYKALQRRGFSGRFRMEGIEVETKNVVPYPATGVPSGLIVPPPPQYLYPFVTELPIQGTADAGVVPAWQDDGFTNDAAPVLPGAIKPESDLLGTVTMYPLVTIAHWIQVPDQLLTDASALRTYINVLMARGVRFKEDNAVLNGATVATILGFNTVATPGPVLAAGQAISVAILAAIIQAETEGGAPVDGIVMNPVDWAATLTQRSDVAGGGPMLLTQVSPLTSLPQQLWGRRVVTTPYQPQGKVLVGAFGTYSILFRNGTVTVSASNEDRDNFIKNLTTIRAESRLALVITRAEAFVTATGVPTVPGFEGTQQRGIAGVRDRGALPAAGSDRDRERNDKDRGALPAGGQNVPETDQQPGRRRDRV